MTLNEIVLLFSSLGFDCNRTPARNGKITLAEMEYDEIDTHWHFRFRYNDIYLNAPSHKLPQSVLDAIAPYISPDDSNTMIFGYSESSDWSEDSTVDEIYNALHREIATFESKMIEIENMVSEWRTEVYAKS